MSDSKEHVRKTPWVEFPHLWRTESAFMSFLRGGIRRALWSKSPIKMEFIKLKRKRIPNPNPRGRVSHVFGATCEICNKDFVLSDMNVDHKVGNHPLKSLDDIQSFIENIVCVSHNDLAMVCIKCHKIKTHAESKGVSMEVAAVEKKAIAIIRGKQDKAFLLSRGITPASNQAGRKTQLLEVLAYDIIQRTEE